MYDVVISISDPQGHYTLGQIVALIELAGRRGYLVEPGSYIGSMTVKQLARLMENHYDA